MVAFVGVTPSLLGLFGAIGNLDRLAVLVVAGATIRAFPNGIVNADEAATENHLAVFRGLLELPARQSRHDVQDLSGTAPVAPSPPEYRKAAHV
jgi:hypothetical protein